MSISQQLDAIYQRDSRRVLATLIRLLGDFDLAEEAMHEAFSVALAQWPDQGIPANPSAWLIGTGHHKGIDHIRRQQTASRYRDQLAEEPFVNEPLDEETILDDQLRLIFTCCHPSLAVEAQLALTLREMCGLTTEQVAHALLQQPTTLAQRIVRAKRKIREAGIAYAVPPAEQLPERLQSVLHVIYLVFNEGYSSSAGEQMINVDLAVEAIRLGRQLVLLLPDTEALGLLALMLLQDSRRAARQTPEGHLVTLEDQDRSLWGQKQIREGLAHLRQAMSQQPVGSYTLQAAIAAAHAEAANYGETDWARIAGLYDLLHRHTPTPVIALNRAVAIAMRDGPEHGLTLLDGLAEAGELQKYHLLHAARADLYRRLGRSHEARESYERALTLTRQHPERRFLQQRLDEIIDSAEHHISQGDRK